MVSNGCRLRLVVSLSFAWIVALQVAAAGGAAAQASPHGAQFQVNAHTQTWQRNPSAAADAAGAFVVAWESGSSPGPDASLDSVQARRYAASGLPLGGQFQVNSFTTGNQRWGVVASSASGAFVVVWVSDGSAGSDTSSYSIQARRYDASGAPVGAQFQVNTYTTNAQYAPAVASDDAGNFVVVWESQGSSGSDTSGYSIQARHYAANGTPLGAQFQVNVLTTDSQTNAAIAIAPLGGFVVAWQSYGSGGSDTSYYSIQARRFGADGTPLGGQFQVNSYTTYGQFVPGVAITAEGGFVVVWDGYGSSGSDTSGYSVHAQRYSAAGAPLGGELQVNTYTTDGQEFPEVAASARGELVVTWTSYGSSGSDSSADSVQGRRYSAGGAALGPEFQVNSYTTSFQSGPAVAVDPAGNFVVAWQSAGSGGTDTDSTSIQAQRYDGLFRDGFETGGTSRWTATSP